MSHFLNSIDDDEIEREWIIEDESDDDEEVVIKINKRLIPRNHIFYKIYKNGCENYIGSTVNLSRRKSLHKSDCNDENSKKYNFPVYQYIRANGGYDTFEYEILDKKFVCKRDAEIYEGELMKIHNSTLNKHRNYSEYDKKQYNKQCQDNSNNKKNECGVCKCFIKRDRNMKVHIQTKKHIKNLEDRIKNLEELEKQDINNITINIENLNINQLPQD